MARQLDRRGDWTETGAARRARDLRAVTVELLREELAAQRRGTESFNAEHVKTELLGKFLAFRKTGYGVNTALAMLYSAHGYPPQYVQQEFTRGGGYPEEVEAILTDLATRLLTDDVARLAEAELYALSPELCDVVTAAAATMTDADCDLIRADDMPMPNGLLILPHTVWSEGPSGEVNDVRAVRWSEPRDLPVVDPKHLGSPRYLRGLQLSTYGDPKETVPDGSRATLAAYAAEKRASLPPLLYTGTRILVLADDVELTGGLAEALAENAIRSRDYVKDLARKAGLSDEEVEVDYERGALISDPTNTFPLRFQYAFSRLCAQQIAVPEQAERTHGAGLQSARLRLPPDVNVVKLRKQQDRREPADPRFHSSVQWKERHMVRMYKRLQHYKSGRTRPVFIGPYVRGPEHLPLAQPRPTVTVVSR